MELELHRKETSQVPGIPWVIPLTNLDFETLPPSFVEMFNREKHYAEEEGMTLSESLNFGQFEPSELEVAGSSDSQVLAAGIVNFGLSVGVPFEAVAVNLAILLEGDCNPEAGFGRAPISRFLKDLQKTRLFDRPSIEFQELALRTVLDLALLEEPKALPQELQSAAYSALATFLTGEKVVLSNKTLQELRAEKPVEEILHRLPLNIATDPKVKLVRSIPGFDLYFDPKGLLTHPDANTVFPLANRLAAEMQKVRQTLLPSGHIHPEMLPTKEEKRQAVQYLLDENRLAVFLSETVDLIKAGLYARTPHGYPDHDVRHILYCVPITSLLLSAELLDQAGPSDNLESVHGTDLETAYTAIFGSIGAYWHDAGRILETHYEHDLPRRQKLDKIHPLVSSALLHQTLERYPGIPLAVKNELLLGIAEHDTRGVFNSRITGFLQSADRLQLIGPEGFTRLFTIGLGCKGQSIFPLSLHPPDLQDSFLGCVNYYLHNLHPTYSAAGELNRKFSVASGALLHLAMRHSYGPLEQVVKPQSLFPVEGWKALPVKLEKLAEQEAARFIRHSQDSMLLHDPGEGRPLRALSPEELVHEILHQPHLSSLDFTLKGVPVRDNLQAQIDGVLQFHWPFRFALEYICETTRQHQSLLEETRVGFSRRDDFLGTFARSIIPPEEQTSEKF